MWMILIFIDAAVNVVVIIQINERSCFLGFNM